MKGRDMDGNSITNATPNESSSAEFFSAEPWPVETPLIEGTTTENSPTLPVDLIPDTRLYVPDHEDWDVHIKRDSERYFCYSKHPGEDWFHLILNGEIYVSHQHEKYCLRCALRMGSLTEDRLFWQHRVPRKRPLVV